MLKNYLLRKFERAFAHFSRPYGDSLWWEAPNLWEPTVQLALLDLCRSGAVVYDVGANFGGLTKLMSRIVGPRGVVCSFEASPRVFPRLQSNIIKQGLQNVTAYRRAVYSRSGELLAIFAGDHLNDSIYATSATGTDPGMQVETISLDDFSAVTGLVPSLVKADVEGAEFDVLSGSAHIIDRHAPHFVLEQQPEDARCLDLLRLRGYLALDLNNYRPIHSPADYPPGVAIRNTLFVHRDKVHELLYPFPPLLEPVMEIAASAFTRKSEAIAAGPFELAPGRYLFDMKFSALGGTQLLCGIRADGKVVFRYHGGSRLLAENYRDWVFDLTRHAKVEIFFQGEKGGLDPSLSVNGGTIRRLAGFEPGRLRLFPV